MLGSLLRGLLMLTFTLRGTKLKWSTRHRKWEQRNSEERQSAKDISSRQIIAINNGGRTLTFINLSDDWRYLNVCRDASIMIYVYIKWLESHFFSVICLVISKMDGKFHWNETYMHHHISHIPHIIVHVKYVNYFAGKIFNSIRYSIYVGNAI